MNLAKLKKQRNKLYILFAIIFMLFASFCVYKLSAPSDGKMTDAIKFKNEYESLNNKIRENSDKKIRSIDIPKDNPFVYAEASDIIKMINQEESFIVYFGFPDCPWCRSVVPTLLKVADDYNIDKIYYVNVKEIRDTIELDSNGETITTKQGTDDYYKLLDLLNNVLEDYKLKNKDNESVSIGEKRIYAPNIITIIDGEAKEMTSGISDLQTDGYMELNEEMKTDMYNKIKCIVKCLNDSQNTCSIKSSC